MEEAVHFTFRFGSERTCPAGFVKAPVGVIRGLGYTSRVLERVGSPAMSVRVRAWSGVSEEGSIPLRKLPKPLLQGT